MIDFERFEMFCNSVIEDEDGDEGEPRKRAITVIKDYISAIKNENSESTTSANLGRAQGAAMLAHKLGLIDNDEYDACFDVANETAQLKRRIHELEQEKAWLCGRLYGNNGV